MEDQVIVELTEASDEYLKNQTHPLWVMPMRCKKELNCQASVKALLELVIVEPVLRLLEERLKSPVPLSLRFGGV